MRNSLGWTGALALAVLVSSAAAAPQEKKGCPMSNKESGLYCEKCTVVLKKEEVKDGKCAKDASDPLKVDVCVKKHYICATKTCGDDKPNSGKCKCGKPLKEDMNRTLISYTCQGCGGQSAVKDKVMHSKDCKKKDIKTACGHAF